MQYSQQVSLSDFQVEKLHRKSRFNEILLAKDNTGKDVILKKIDKSKTKLSFIQNEIRAGIILRKHNHVVKLFGHFNDGDCKYLVQEYLEGKDLFELLEINEFRPVKEKYAKGIFRQIAKTVANMHQHGIFHRDIKLENIILLQDMKNVKLIDFGLCSIEDSSKEQLLDTFCGSPDYVCPEILHHKPYAGYQADVWAMGVVLYALLFAELPFSLEERLESVHNHEEHPKLVIPPSSHVSKEAIDLVKKMLSIDPSMRPTVKEILNHPWLRQRFISFVSC